jgi:exodeoxyribonuclease VII large subunit
MSNGHVEWPSSFADPRVTGAAMQELPLVAAAAQPVRALTVSEVNNRARILLERSFARIAVDGEISNHKAGAAGHQYFTLKDSGAQLPVALFRRDGERLRFPLRDGQAVTVTGRLTVYARDGRYQMVADAVALCGAGTLAAEFEALKRRLAEEGLFDVEKKRPLPRLPRRVAVVTSEAGAVIRDIIQVATRRFPNCHITLVPAPVQGAECARLLIEALDRAADLAPDVLIIGRGGGSMEDLWGFNDEALARALARCAIPVVSAVGHETDFTICDLVADVRAPTPSAAAELVFPIASEIERALMNVRDRMRRALAAQIDRRRLALSNWRRRVGDPGFLLRDARQSVSDSVARAERALARHVRIRRRRLGVGEARLARRHPREQVLIHRARTRSAGQRVAQGMLHRCAALRAGLTASGQRLHALSPLQVLGRGYAICLQTDGTVLTDSRQARPGQDVQVRLHRGSVVATIKERQHES